MDKLVDQCASDRSIAQSTPVQGKVETFCFNFLGAAENLLYNMNKFVKAVPGERRYIVLHKFNAQAIILSKLVALVNPSHVTVVASDGSWAAQGGPAIFLLSLYQCSVLRKLEWRERSPASCLATLLHSGCPSA